MVTLRISEKRRAHRCAGGNLFRREIDSAAASAGTLVSQRGPLNGLIPEVAICENAFCVLCHEFAKFARDLPNSRTWNTCSADEPNRLCAALAVLAIDSKIDRTVQIQALSRKINSASSNSNGRAD